MKKADSFKRPDKRPEPVIVGPANDQKKEAFKQEIVYRFGEGHYKQIPAGIREILESLEYEKKPYEKLAIKIANEITNSIMKKSGVQPFDIPERNIHLVSADLFKGVGKNEKEVAITIQDRQMIIINTGSVIYPLERASVIFHEMIHLKNYLSVEVYDDLEIPRRRGFLIEPSRKKKERIKLGFFTAFSGFDEAVVSEMEKRYFPRFISSNKFLADEFQWQNSKEAQEIKKRIAEEEGEDIDEIMWVSKDGKIFRFFPYYAQRKVLNYIVDILYQDNADRFSSRDEIMELFFQSHFNGRLLSIAKLIEKSFGKGAFRVLGMMDKERNSAILVMDYLRKHRIRKE